ncbi:MAG: amidohydrolase family protein [Pseudomonadales bacterium]|nr:amidohydrolase family protein [Pseudomonadales bacterium]
MHHQAYCLWQAIRLAVVPVLLSASGSLYAQPENCAGVNDLLLNNGVIHTMDDADTVVSAVRILDGRINGRGTDGMPTTACTQVIDLQGRTVVPGLIDNHNHIVLLGLRPGHDTRLENATSIAEVLALLQARAAGVAAGEWLTAIGGFDINQFVPAPAAPRFPTRAELDTVASGHPIYIQQGFAGPGVTNSLGKRFFESKGIAVGDDGSLTGGLPPNPATRALYELNQLQTLDAMKRGTLDALNYAVSLGITTQLDQGGFPATDSASDGAASFDPYRAYDAVLALYHEGRLPNRLRLNFLHMETDPATPQLQARLNNVFAEFGDDSLRIVGIGEFTAGISPIITQQTEEWLNGTRRVAQAGWRNENHSLTPSDFRTIIDGWQQINEELGGDGITQLGWVLAHAPFITEEYARKLQALGAGVSVLGGWRYISGTSQSNGPPFRMLHDLGIPMGMSSDGMQISPMNPWLGLYYVVSGRNARGELINAGQTLPRTEALRLYTAANRWFLQEEDIGSLEAGKLADLVVLDRDYFDADAVSDEDIKNVHAVLTLVGGKIVHGDPARL